MTAAISCTADHPWRWAHPRLHDPFGFAGGGGRENPAEASRAQEPVKASPSTQGSPESSQSVGPMI